MALRLHSSTDMHTDGNATPSSAHAIQASALEEYDLVFLGGGTGSTVAAWTFASQGQRVAVIERKYIGGSCPNIACLPSKNILHSAKVASYLRRGEEFGIVRRRAFALRCRRCVTRKRAMVSGLNEMYLDNYTPDRSGIHSRIGPLHRPQDCGSRSYRTEPVAASAEPT